tara:strand:+ start:376 stop:1962 length:1587 start_codon:yes stop_codon:yes gene_type:complete
MLAEEDDEEGSDYASEDTDDGRKRRKKRKKNKNNKNNKNNKRKNNKNNKRKNRTKNKTWSQDRSGSEDDYDDEEQESELDHDSDQEQEESEMSEVSYHSSDSDPDDTLEVQMLRKKVRFMNKKRSKLIKSGPKIMPTLKMTMSLNEIQEARVLKIEQILLLEKNKLSQLEELAAIREKAMIIGEMKHLTEGLEALEMQKAQMFLELKEKKMDLEVKLEKLEKLHSPVTKTSANKKNRKRNKESETKDDRREGGYTTDDEWLSEKEEEWGEEDHEAQYSRGRANRERKRDRKERKEKTSKGESKISSPSTSSVDNNAVRRYYNTFGSAENPSFQEETEVSTHVWVPLLYSLERSLEHKLTFLFFLVVFGPVSCFSFSPSTQNTLTLRQLARGERTKKSTPSNKKMVAPAASESSGGPRWAKLINEDVVDLQLSPVNYEPMVRNGSRRNVNRIKQRGGGNPANEGKWRVLKLGNGQRITVNLVCGYCHQDNSASNVNHARVRCDLCDRPLKQKGYNRAVGAKAPPGRLLV